VTTHDDHPMTPELAATIAEWDAAAALARASYTERAALMLAGIIPSAEPRPCYVCGRPALHTIGGRRYCSECAPMTPPPARIHVTAQMLFDIWSVEGPARVAATLRQLPHDDRDRLAREYWNLLRGKGHNASLVEIGIQFCVVERLAA
jgi:hypothetical protein